MSYQVLVEEKDGTQGLRILDDTTDYKGNVIWDERVDGPLPSIEAKDIGGLVRSGNKIDFDQAKQDALVEAKKADIDPFEAHKAAAAQAKIDFKSAKTVEEKLDLVAIILNI